MQEKLLKDELALDEQQAHSQNLTHRNLGAIAGVLLSRSIGVVRTVIINAYFGANVTLDAFNTAFRFPNSLRDLFADGALSAAFTKSLVDIKPAGLAKERELIAIAMGFFLTITVLLAIIGAFFAQSFIRLMSDATFQASGGLALATQLFTLLVFYLPLTMINAVIMAILGVKGLLFRAMNGSLFLSIGMVAGIIFFSPYFSEPIFGLAWGALFGALLQLIYQAWPVLRMGLLAFPVLNPFIWWHYHPLHTMVRLMLPRALGQGATILALMINTYFALSLGSGVMTFVATTIIIIQVPIGLFGVATGFASLPVLTVAINERQGQRFSLLLTQSLNTSLWLATFTTLGLALFIVPLYRIIFQHGAINFTDTLQNALCICAYASGIIFSAAGKLLLNALYALDATRKIVWNSVLYLVASATLSAILVPRLGITGLGLAFGLASAANYWLNYYFVYHAFRQRHPDQSPYFMGGRYYTAINLLISLLAFAVSFLGIYLTTQVWPLFTDLTGLPLSLLNASWILIIAGLLFCIVFLGATYYLGPAHLQCVLKRYCRRS